MAIKNYTTSVECPVCGGVAKKVRENRIGRYFGEAVTVKTEFLRCSVCGDESFSPEQAHAHSDAVKRAIRKKARRFAIRRFGKRGEWLWFLVTPWFVLRLARNYPDFLIGPEVRETGWELTTRSTDPAIRGRTICSRVLRHT